MATVIVNGQEVQIGDQERLNLIQAAQRVGVEIPHYCWHPAMTVVASCRMCLVEVGDTDKDGKVNMVPRVVPGCQTPAKNGTVIVTNSPKVKEAQAATLEYLLLNHPLDCPVCDQAGECYLQDYSYKFGRAYSRLKDDKVQRPDKDHIGEQITLFTDRCVMCTRCVRFTREISGTAELMVTHRGDHEEIDIFPGEPCDNKLAGNVVDLCPVGALCSKDFLYKQRVWFLQSANSVCGNCSTGCSIHVDQNKNILYRLRPRYNPQAQGHFMCDEGRFGFKYVNSQDRLLSPQVRSNGKQLHVEWDAMLPALRRELKAAAQTHGAGFAVMLSPWLTVEEAYLAAILCNGWNKEIKLYLGPVPVVGEDDLYPKGPHGEPPKNAKDVRFTIRAEKCPNRRGVEAVIHHIEGEVKSFGSLLHEIDAGNVKAVYAIAGYPSAWLDEEQAKKFEKLELLVVQDILPSPASALAKYVLPGGSFAEKEGTFVNHANLAQMLRRAIHSPGEARPDGRILMELAERRGLFHAATLRKEIAAALPFFAAMASGDLGDFGATVGWTTDAEMGTRAEPVLAVGS
jgi:NADH-quinone oxidoreductase subunit G